MILNDIGEAVFYSKKFDVPIEDVILIALNAMGIKARTKDNRIRFKLKLEGKETIFYQALCVNTSETPFELESTSLLFNGKKIGYVVDVEKDTCDTTYFRREKTTLTLNSNSRSSCRGCSFCGTYNQYANDENDLKSSCKLKKHIKRVLSDNGIKDMAGFIDVGICTGCFESEEDALNHIFMIRKVLKSEFNFSGEIKYLGSQITCPKNIELLSSIKPFSMYLTTECFERRERLMRKEKAFLDIKSSIKLLDFCKRMSFQTTFLYVLGLDSLKGLEKGFRILYPHVTRFPIINIFQNYLPEQENLRHSEAKSMDYYLKARGIIENLFIKTNLRPKAWENYRSPWHFKFKNEELVGIKI